ncbi:type II toxin-antitoxin system VapC family toxin [Crossiella sp. CA-258035]|uniref:type II toxin-antitoxin system VapC family toxin n=1 Tax=Crossiella sp. CA-258035 TaxID=2981138 RepID=UPI0024BCA194|nr:type II toxin-antitoxin system VapC family toxin [Crossiella sp. CA-258035]WHT18034.1 type II toxin-antitoxin system VapC family toxin [Crossiella sp. CA-258035]
MIVLDTNVVSELMRRAPNDEVVRWVDRYPADEVFVTAVTAAELAYGVERMPDGQRKTALAVKVSELLTEDLQGQILPFDGLAAAYYGEIAAAREKQGSPISMADAQIAAICRRCVACLATRNTKDFADTGITVLNPWGDADEV